MLTGSKTAFTPVEVDQPTVEVEAEGETPLDSPMPKTPAGDNTDEQGGAGQAEEVAEKLASMALDPSASSQQTAEGKQPLSTRFRPPGETVPEPRIEFHAHETPTLSGDKEGDSAAANGDSERTQQFDPFGVDHAELGVPAQPLFKIDQMGVDRRMLVNRKKQLRMYR
jgi:hypothetical protein